MLTRRVKANGYDFAYVEAGGGEPLLFVHGSLLDYRYWQDEVDEFAQEFRTIALSRRHHWPNVQPAGPFEYKAAGQTDDVIAFVEALDCGPVHLVGHSYGGYLAARLACLRPDLLLSLVLVEPGGPIEGEVQGRSRVEDHNKGAAMVASGDTAGGVAHFLDTVCFEPKWEDGTEEYKMMTLSNAITITEQVRETRPTLEAAALASLQCPTLLMIGGRSISPFPETLARLNELIQASQIATVPDASHMVNQDNPQAFRAALWTFLRK